MASARSEPVTLDYLKKMVENYEQDHTGFTLNIPDVLQKLPAEFKTRYALMYRSASAQESDFLNPRVILFGLDAKAILTFNGHSAQRNHNRLELVFFNELLKKPEFYTMNFPAKDSREGQVKFSTKNPAECASCHSVGFHYKWRQYASWNGSYGSRDDVLELGGREGTSPVPVDEKKEFLKFKAAAVTHPRYSKLINLISDTESVFPFREIRAGKNGDYLSNYDLSIESRPNAHLGMLLMRLQAKALAQEIMTARNFSEMKMRLGFLLNDCAKESYIFNEINQILLELNIKKELFHLQTKVDNYNSGLSTFFAAVNSEIFLVEFSNDKNLRPFYLPLRMSYLLANTDIPLIRDLYKSPYGLKIWRTLDDTLPIQSRSFGSRELDNYFQMAKLPTLTDEKHNLLCKEFSKS